MKLKHQYLLASIIGIFMGISCLAIAIVYRDRWDLFLPWGIIVIIAEFTIAFYAFYRSQRINE